ncbi:unnamed protein product [Angiostrongylus costaricensis]|uniref:Cauli_VI domain-containing protein n=1 Tax=Angiostrongylus costaricensis TaxID=334426 RepID=A0A0R3PCF4_ANGCS|nr:unnamed protein product [Angiostrongylus costaricensis]
MDTQIGNNTADMGPVMEPILVDKASILVYMEGTPTSEPQPAPPPASPGAPYSVFLGLYSASVGPFQGLWQELQTEHCKLFCKGKLQAFVDSHKARILPFPI